MSTKRFVAVSVLNHSFALSWFPRLQSETITLSVHWRLWPTVRVQGTTEGLRTTSAVGKVCRRQVRHCWRAFGVQKIHLVSPQGKQGPPLYSLVGQTITMRVDDLYRSSTAGHFGNAVSDKYSIVPASGAPKAGWRPSPSVRLRSPW